MTAPGCGNDRGAAGNTSSRRAAGGSGRSRGWAVLFDQSDQCPRPRGHWRRRQPDATPRDARDVSRRAVAVVEHVDGPERRGRFRKVILSCRPPPCDLRKRDVVSGTRPDALTHALDVDLGSLRAFRRLGGARALDQRVYLPGQPDSVRGCTSMNAAGWPKRWRRCATTIELERRCPDRRRQRRRGGRINSVSGPGRSPPAWVASRRPDRYRASAPRQCRAPSSRGTSPVSSAPGRSKVTAGLPPDDCGAASSS